MAFVYSADGEEKIQLEEAPDLTLVEYDDPSAFPGDIESLEGGDLLVSDSMAVLPMDYEDMKSQESGAYRRLKSILPVFVDPRSKLLLAATREIVVCFKEGTPLAEQQTFLRDFRLKVGLRADRFDPNQYIVTSDEVEREREVLEVANKLFKASQIVRLATPNFLAQFERTSPRRASLPKGNPLLYHGRWHLDVIKAAEARAKLQGGGNPVTVAIVDDGIDLRHPDLKPFIWEDPNERGVRRHGANYHTETLDPSPSQFRKPYNKLAGNDIHGTPCAGCVLSVWGDAPERLFLLPVKIFAAPYFAAQDKAAAAITYASRHADVISCSWRSPNFPLLEQAIERAGTTGRGGKGCLIFCASGNEGVEVIEFPANHPRAIAVGASNSRDERASYSNYGRGLTMIAPGGEGPSLGGIHTTDMSTPGLGYNPGSNYVDDFEGTSAATAIAAGIGALMLAANPELKLKDVKEIFSESCDSVKKIGSGKKTGYGRVNAQEAVKKAAKRKAG